MRVRGPLPAATLPRAASPLRLTAAHAADLDGDSPLAADPDLRAFTADLVRPYGLELDEDTLTGARGQTYTALAELAVHALTVDHRPVDLLLLVYATPDVRPGLAVAVQLGGLCPGAPLAFALSDEGAAGAFSALRIADAYARTAGARRALLIAVEQAHLAHRPHRPARMPDRHSVSALLWEAEGAGRALHLLDGAAEVTQDQVSEVLRKLCADLPGNTLLVLGPGLAATAAPEGIDTRRARERNPCTGGWTALGHALADPGFDGRPLALADHEPDTGRLDLACWAPVAGESEGPR